MRPITVANASQRLPGPWLDIWLRHTGALRGQVEWIENEEIAAALREEARVPPELVDLVASRLDGSARRPRGRPVQLDDPITGMQEAFALATEIAVRKAAFREQGLSKPAERALKALALERHEATTTLTKRVRKRRREHPTLFPSRERPLDLRPLVRAMVAGGYATLDPSAGLRWTDRASGLRETHLLTPE